MPNMYTGEKTPFGAGKLFHVRKAKLKPCPILCKKSAPNRSKTSVMQDLKLENCWKKNMAKHFLDMGTSKDSPVV